MTVVIKYNAGNVQSVMCALKRLGVEAVLSDDEHLIRSADHVIFPGVGEAGSAMSYLEEKGMVDIIRGLRMPFLGICLGMQLLFESTSAFGTVGLSTGITPDLCDLAKMIVIMTMYVGRLGVMTVATLGTYKEPSTATFTTEEITIG